MATAFATSRATSSSDAPGRGGGFASPASISCSESEELGEAPVVAPGVNFAGDTFAKTWAGWKFSGCLYFALVTLGPDANLAMALAMVPYVIVDIFAYTDSAHWTPLAAGFIVLDACGDAVR